MDPEGLKAPLLSRDEREEYEEAEFEARRSVYLGTGRDPPAASYSCDASISSGMTGRLPSLPFATVFGGRSRACNVVGAGGAGDWSLTSSISHDDDDEEDSSSLSPSPEQQQDKEDFMMTAFRRYSLFLGLLVGGFIQLSSLGANYLLSEIFRDKNLRQATVVRFSLAWSISTSILGVAILLLVRVLIHQVAENERRGRRFHLFHEHSRELLLHLECYFAVGTLAGVCMAWTCTDLLLGFHNHVWHSLLSLFLALVWWKVVSFYYGIVLRRQRNDDSSLVENQEDEEDQDTADMTVDSNVTIISFRKPKKLITRKVSKSSASTVTFSWQFILISLMLGFIVGLFIQLSSLGANFVLSNLHHTLPNNHILAFSLVWSVVASTMGVLMLSLARNLISMVLNTCATTATATTPSSVPQLQDYAWLLRLEAFFAVGALLGVNVAWIGTDILLEVKVHYFQSLWTELLALLLIGYAVHCRATAGAWVEERDYDCEDDETVEITVV